MQETTMKAWRIGAYGTGDFGFNLFFTGLSIFLLRYYTDVLELSPAVAGTMVMVPVIWDAITDPLMGWIASRTRTKFGRFRPYILIGGPLMGGSFVLMFAAPLLFPGAVIAASVIAHLLFRTLYTVSNIPYTALSATMTRDSSTRSALAAARMFAGLLGGLTAAYFTLPLAVEFGNGNARLGFAYVAAIYGIVATILMFFVAAAAEEETDPASQRATPTTKETLRFLSRNTAFTILGGAIFIGAAANTIVINSLNYYAAYAIELPAGMSSETAVGLVLAVTLLIMALSAPFWGWLSQKISKRLTWLIGAGGGASISLILYLVFPRDFETLIYLQAANALFAGSGPVLLWSMAPDTVEYGEWRSGVRDDAIVFGLIQLALKSGQGLTAGILGFLLAAIGYVANQPQTEMAIEGLRVMTFLISALGATVAASVIFFYPIDDRLHGRLRRALRYRDTRKSAE